VAHEGDQCHQLGDPGLFLLGVMSNAAVNTMASTGVGMHFYSPDRYLGVAGPYGC
jgi:hypothetical protein